MQYEKFILELMERVSALENEVAKLKERSSDNISIPIQSKRCSPNERDTTKYIFDGIRYGKNRLVLAIVKKYVSSHPDISADELTTIFNSSLQGSLGVVRTLQDVKNNYRDYERRFFCHNDEIISTKSEDCVVCTQWGAFNISNIIARAKELGMNITEI